jgi:hypothetical protein
VCETLGKDRVFLSAEKTAKCFQARRLFVAFAVQGFLQHYRDWGFETFGDVLDESYDNEPDDETRWNMALEQVRLICQQDQQIIFKSIVPIVLHNRDLIARLPVNQTRIALETLMFEEELKNGSTKLQENFEIVLKQIDSCLKELQTE